MNVAKKQNARTEKASIFTSPRMRRLVWLRLYRNRYIYLMILPVIVYFILLKYVPMWFLRSAFYDYKLRLGFEGSKYVGLKYFERLFTNPNLLNYIGNTLKLNIAALVILFPMPVIFAIMLNEMRNVKFMKFVQTISYLPAFRLHGGAGIHDYHHRVSQHWLPGAADQAHGRYAHQLPEHSRILCTD